MPKIIRFAKMDEVPVTLHFSLDTDKLCAQASGQPLRKAELTAEGLISITREESEKILSDAHAEADHLVCQAQQQVESLHQQAYREGHDQGFQQGYQEGLSSGQQQISEAVERAQQILRDATSVRQQRLEAMDDEIVDLAVQIAEKIIHQQIDAHNPIILSVAKEAIGKVQGQEQIVIRVHPADYELIQMAAEELQRLAGSEKPLTVMADLAIQQGGCVIDTAFGSVDARIDSQLGYVKKCMMDVMK